MGRNVEPRVRRTTPELMTCLRAAYNMSESHSHYSSVLRLLISIIRVARPPFYGNMTNNVQLKEMILSGQMLLVRPQTDQNAASRSDVLDHSSSMLHVFKDEFVPKSKCRGTFKLKDTCLPRHGRHSILLSLRRKHDTAICSLNRYSSPRRFAVFQQPRTIDHDGFNRRIEIDQLLLLWTGLYWYISCPLETRA